jgi:integrase
MDTERRCEALKTNGHRCRNRGTAYHPDGQGGEVLLCNEHQRQARDGRLRLPHKPKAEPGPSVEAAPEPQEPTHNLPAEPFQAPPDHHPLQVYEARLTSAHSRTSARRAARLFIEALTGQEGDPESFPWPAVRYQHLQAFKQALGQRYAPGTVNTNLAYVKGLLREAWRLGYIDAETYARINDVKATKGSRLPPGRSLSPGELRALFAACADGTAGGKRDAALFAVLYGGGLRRAEAVALDRADYHQDTGELRVRGKGDRERLAHATNGAAVALGEWLAVRGDEPGPLFCPVGKGGKVSLRRLTAQAVLDRCRHRAKQAGIQPFSPHDLRRTFVGDLLDSGADVGSVQRLAGHADVSTTLRYDRRPEEAKRRAADMIQVPVIGESG